MKPSEIFKKVCDTTGYGKTILISKCRARSMVRARALFSIISRAYGMSYPEIAGQLHRDHTSIMNHIKHFSKDAVVGDWLLKIDDPMVETYFKDLK